MECFDIHAWLEQLEANLTKAFPGRIVCLGIQGSFARGEAAADSDMDVVLILDKVSMADLQVYNGLLDAQPERARACGFISGAEVLMSWDRAELFQFYYDTKPILGSLEMLRPLLSRECIARAVHTGACAIYHAAAHNFLYDHAPALLQSVLKSAGFVLVAKEFLRSGVYRGRRAELKEVLSGQDKAVFDAMLSWKQSVPTDISAMHDVTALLLDWAGNLIRTYGPERTI